MPCAMYGAAVFLCLPAARTSLSEARLSGFAGLAGRGDFVAALRWLRRPRRCRAISACSGVTTPAGLPSRSMRLDAQVSEQIHRHRNDADPLFEALGSVLCSLLSGELLPDSAARCLGKGSDRERIARTDVMLMSCSAPLNNGRTADPSP